MRDSGTTRNFRFSRAVAAVLGLCACVQLPAAIEVRGQGVGTRLVVDVDPGLELSCADTISFAPTPAQLTQLLTGVSSANGQVTRTSPPSGVSVSAAPGGWTVNISGLDTGLVSTSLLDEALDVCVVRAIGFRFGSYVVSAQLTGNTILEGPNGSRVQVTSVGTRAGYSTAAYASQFSVSWVAMFFFLGGQFTVDLQVGFNLANATRPGTHSSPAPGVIRVTASAP